MDLSTWTDKQLLDRVTADARQGIYDVGMCSALAARQANEKQQKEISMRKFGQKTTAAISAALPCYNGMLAERIPTQRKNWTARRAVGIAMIVAGASYLVGTAVISLYLYVRFGAV